MPVPPVNVALIDESDFGVNVVLLPFVMRQVPLPKELERHRALVCLAVVTVLLAALIASCRPRYLWSEAYPLTAVGLLYPWLMLVCLRYIPLSRCLRASAACAVSAARTASGGSGNRETVHGAGGRIKGRCPD